MEVSQIAGVSQHVFADLEVLIRLLLGLGVSNFQCVFMFVLVQVSMSIFLRFWRFHFLHMAGTIGYKLVLLGFVVVT